MEGTDQVLFKNASNFNYLIFQLVHRELENILAQYYCFKDHSQYYPIKESVVIKFNQGNDPAEFGEISYQFPERYEDFEVNDYLWFCPTIFSLFHFEDFFKILTAVFLERSLVFVSDNYNILSSCVLGFRTLLKPFQWCYALIPVLPSPLVDIVDAPQPILVGLTKKDYRSLQMSEEDKRNKTWIIIDENRIKWS